MKSNILKLIAVQYNRQQRVSWLEKAAKNTFKFGKKGISWALYKLGNTSHKIKVHEERINDYKNQLSYVRSQRKNLFYRIDLNHANNPKTANLEKEALDKQYQPTIKELQNHIEREQQQIKLLQKQIVKKQQPIPRAKTPPTSTPPVAKPITKRPKTKRVKVVPPSPKAPKQEDYIPLEKRLKSYSIDQFYQDLNRTVEDYMTLAPGDKEGFVNTHLSAIKDTNSSEEARLYHIGVVQRIENIENKLYYTDYTKDQILPELSSASPFLEMYLNSANNEQLEIKNLITSVIYNPDNYTANYLQDAKAIWKEIQLHEARQKAQELNQLQQKAKKDYGQELPSKKRKL